MINSIKIGDIFKNKEDKSKFKIISEKKARQLRNDCWVDNIIENNKHNFYDVKNIVWIENLNDRFGKTGWMNSTESTMRWINKDYVQVGHSNYFKNINYKFLNDAK